MGGRKAELAIKRKSAWLTVGNQCQVTLASHLTIPKRDCTCAFLGYDLAAAPIGPAAGCWVAPRKLDPMGITDESNRIMTGE
jgi:hypothetical protein